MRKKAHFFVRVARRLSGLSVVCLWICVFWPVLQGETFRLSCANKAFSTCLSSLRSSSTTDCLTGIGASELETARRWIPPVGDRLSLLPQVHAPRERDGRRLLCKESSALCVALPSLLQCTYTRTLVGFFGRLAEHAANFSWGIAASIEFDMKAGVEHQQPLLDVSPMARRHLGEKPTRAPWRFLLLLKSALVQLQNFHRLSKRLPLADASAEINFSELPPDLLRRAVQVVSAPDDASVSLADRLFALIEEGRGSSSLSASSKGECVSKCNYRSLQERIAKERRAARRLAQRQQSLVQRVSLSFKEFVLLTTLLPFRLPFEVFEALSNRRERAAFAASSPTHESRLSAGVSAAAAIEKLMQSADATAQVFSESDFDVLGKSDSPCQSLGREGRLSAVAASAVASMMEDKFNFLTQREAEEMSKVVKVSIPEGLKVSQLRGGLRRAGFSTPPTVQLPLLSLVCFARIRRRLLHFNALRGMEDKPTLSEEETESATCQTPIQVLAHASFGLDSFTNEPDEEGNKETNDKDGNDKETGDGWRAAVEAQREGDWRADWIQTVNLHVGEELRFDLRPLIERLLREERDGSSPRSPLPLDALAAVAAASNVFAWFSSPEKEYASHSTQRIHKEPPQLNFASLRRRVLRETEGEVDQTVFLEDFIRGVAQSRV